MEDGSFFCMAGLWEKWIRPARTGEFDLGDDTAAGQTIETFTIITTEPNAMVARVHNRMPAILSSEHFQWWLEPNRFDPEFLKTILSPFPAEEMACVRVSKNVNNAKHDSPDCLQPG